MRTLPVKFLLMLTAWFAFLIGAVHAAEKPAAAPTIAVEAEGQVMAVPDLARLTLEVETRAPQAEAAAQETSRRAFVLIKALKAALTPDDHVKTLGYRLTPVYAPKNKTSPPEIKGYQAVHRLQVKIKVPGRLGEVIDLALKNGASGVSGPYWEHSRIDELQRQAAVAALERARHLAEALAQSQGLKITGVEKISTGIHFRPRGGGDFKAMAAAPATPIEVGEEAIRATVQAIFQVKP